MKEVTINTWCDRHDAEFAKGQNRVPATVQRTLPGWLIQAPMDYTLDLCDACDRMLLDNVRVLMSSHGAAVEATKGTRKRGTSLPPGEGVPCPEPGCDARSTTRHALGAHTRDHHGHGLRYYISNGTLPALPQGARAHREPPLKAV